MSYWAKSSGYFHCQAIQRLYFKLKLKSLLYLIRNRFDLDSTSSKPRWVGPLLCPLHGDLQRVITEIDQIASQIIYYIVYLHTYLYYSQPNPSIWTCLWQMAGTSLLRSLVLSMKVTNFAWFANPEGANRSRGSHGTTDRVSSQVCHFMTYFFTRLA